MLRSKKKTAQEEQKKATEQAKKRIEIEAKKTAEIAKYTVAARKVYAQYFKEQENETNAAYKEALNARKKNLKDQEEATKKNDTEALKKLKESLVKQEEAIKASATKLEQLRAEKDKYYKGMIDNILEVDRYTKESQEKYKDSFAVRMLLYKDDAVATRKLLEDKSKYTDGLIALMKKEEDARNKGKKGTDISYSREYIKVMEDDFDTKRKLYADDKAELQKTLEQQIGFYDMLLATKKKDEEFSDAAIELRKKRHAASLKMNEDNADKARKNREEESKYYDSLIKNISKADQYTVRSIQINQDSFQIKKALYKANQELLKDDEAKLEANKKAYEATQKAEIAYYEKGLKAMKESDKYTQSSLSMQINLFALKREMNKDNADLLKEIDEKETEYFRKGSDRITAENRFTAESRAFMQAKFEYLERAYANDEEGQKSLAFMRGKYAEDYVKHLDTQIAKYGESIKYSEDARKAHEEYFNYLESTVQGEGDNEEEKESDRQQKLVAINEQRLDYDKKYHEESAKLQADAAAESIAKVSEEEQKKAAEAHAAKVAAVKSLDGLQEAADVEEMVRYQEQLEAKVKASEDAAKKITALQSNMVQKETNSGFLGLFLVDIGKTHENYHQLKEERKKLIDQLKQDKVDIENTYTALLANLDKGSQAWQDMQAEKQAALNTVNKQITDQQEAAVADQKTYAESMIKNAQDIHAKATEYAQAGINVVKAFYADDVAELEEDIKKTSELLAKKEAATKEHQSKLESLQKEATTASGGRAVAIQEQIAREMQARDESAAQQKELEKEKEKLEKEKTKKEKRQKRLDLAMQLQGSIASTATGVAVELAKGIVGIPTAAIIGAKGLVEIMTIRTAMRKLEDGGLLRGKRHSQGGMKVEGTNIEVEGDEYVVNRTSTRKNIGLIEYINTQRRELSSDDINAYYARSGRSVSGMKASFGAMFEDGGQLVNLSTVDSVTSVSAEAKMLEALGQINIKPVVSVVDITNAQQSLTQVKDIAGV